MDPRKKIMLFFIDQDRCDAWEDRHAFEVSERNLWIDHGRTKKRPTYSPTSLLQ